MRNNMVSRKEILSNEIFEGMIEDITEKVMDKKKLKKR
jgi:hypothetical protein